MKEDAQLICPISYEDPDGHWSQLEPAILDRLPLREVTWKSPISSTYITISKLPLRFLPTDANLFKDTDHPFRWFLSQYVNLYVVVAETLETYKVVKPNVKKWVDSNNNSRGSFGKRFWVVIYLTLGNYPSSHYAKIFAKIASDFYFERSGDRTVMLSMRSDPSSTQIGSTLKTTEFQLFSSANDGLGDLMSKIREGIVSSFQVRSSLYYTEIRKLDATRGTPTFDFKQLFLVKESFALLYQMMQLLDMALAQYEELEAMLAYAPPGILFDGWWPLKAPELLKSSDTLSPEPSSSKEKEKEKDIMADPVKNGDDIVTYSINIARMKVLKGKMSLLELYRYVFSRQMFFLVTMHRPVDCAEKVRRFMTFSYHFIESKISDIGDRNEKATAHMQATVWAFAASIKCVRLCRDLIDSMIASENVNGLESTQSVAAILNVVRSTTYRLGGGDSDQRESSLMAGDRSNNRDTHLAKDKMLAFRESFILMGDILQTAVQRFNQLVPIKHMLRHQSIQNMHQNRMFCDDSLPLLPDDDSSCAYFQLFERTADARATLDRDLDSSSFTVAGGLEQVLSAISQRIRSVSHYWAKVYHMKTFETLYAQENVDIINDRAKRYMFLVSSCRFQPPQIEKGRILEASLHALITLVASEFNILCDRRSVALVERFNLSQHLFCTGQFLKSSQVLNGLMLDSTGGNLFMNPWAMSWPDLMLSMLIMMARCALELKEFRDFRKAVASMVTLIIHQKDFLGANLSCSFEKVIKMLICPPAEVIYDDCFSIPAKGLFKFDLLQCIYPEDVSPKEEKSLSKLRSSANKPAPPIPLKVIADAAMKVIVSADHVIRRKGMQLVHENPFPVQWLVCVCDKGPIPIKLRIKSLLTENVPVHSVKVFLRRVPPQGFDKIFGTVDAAQHTGGLGDELPPLSPPLSLNPVTLSRASSVTAGPSTAIAEVDDSVSGEELSCLVQLEDDFSLEGEIELNLELSPHHLGDFMFDRFEIYSGSLIFSHRILDAFESLSSQTLDFQSHIVSDENVQRYFDNFPILRVSPPRHILSFDIHSGGKQPPNQKDYVYVTFDVPEGDFVSELSIDVKAISRCRRWGGNRPITTSFEASSSMQYRAEWITSPARSFYRAGEEHSYSVDESAHFNQYMARDYAVIVDSPKEWKCWESDSSMHRTEKEIVVLQDTLLLRDITGGKCITVRIPVTIRTSLLTNIAEEFTLQSPLQIQIQGVIRKGVCVVPFQATGNSTLLCSNLLKNLSSQQLSANGSHKQLVQFQLYNIHHQSLCILGNAFVLGNGEITDVQDEIRSQCILYPEDLTLFSSTTDVIVAQEKLFSFSEQSFSGIYLSPVEEFYAFLQVVPVVRNDNTENIGFWRVFYRREEQAPICTFTATNDSLFWVDVPLALSTISSSISESLVASNPLPSREGRIFPLVTTQAPLQCQLGDVVIFRVRVGLRGSMFRYLIDKIDNLSSGDGENENGSANLMDFRSSFHFQLQPSNVDVAAEQARCELLECPAWVPVGMKVLKAPTSLSILEYEIQVAVIPVITGLQNLPPLMIHFSNESTFGINPLLLIPHHASQLSHALIHPIRSTQNLQDSSEVPVIHTVLASFEEFRV